VASGADQRGVWVRPSLQEAGRVFDVAKFDEAIYVLHCFQKKTQVTSKQDIAIAAVRYRAVVKARKEEK